MTIEKFRINRPNITTKSSFKYPISQSGIGAVSVLNHYYGRDDIVLGAYKGEFGKYCDGSWVPGEYIYDLVNNFDSPVWNSDQVDEATVAYRKVLAAAEDNSVKIAAIG